VKKGIFKGKGVKEKRKNDGDWMKKDFPKRAAAVKKRRKRGARRD